MNYIEEFVADMAKDFEANILAVLERELSSGLSGIVRKAGEKTDAFLLQIITEFIKDQGF